MGSLKIQNSKGEMFKLEISQNVVNPTKQSSHKTRLRESKEIHFDDNKSRDFKQNQSKHLNAIKPYVNKQRKNSKRQIRPVCSSSQISRSKSKRLQKSSHKLEQASMISCQNICLTNPSQNASSRQINQIYQEMMILKTEYKSLKSSYNSLVKEKQQATFKEEQKKQNFEKQKQVMMAQLEKYKKNNTFLESEIERIKRECFKILQSEKFKYKKLQQTLQQKELMIAYLRKQIQNLKKGKQSSNASQQNLQKIFFLQNSAPIFSYESYARLSANNSMMSGIGNVLIEEQTPEPKQSKPIYRNKKSQLQEDSLSFSRDNMRQFDSVHSLLTNNNDQTILTFTKKDVVVLDDSLSLNDPNSNQKQECPTFQNRKSEGKEIISFQSLKYNKAFYKSESRGQSKKAKNSRQNTKRLEILTDQFNEEKKNEQDKNSCETKKKFSKSKIKSTKKTSKSQGLHNSLINETGHGSFIKKDSHQSHIKNQLSSKQK